MATYEIYKKTTDGKRGVIIEDYSKFSATLRFNEVGKWQMSSLSNDYSPLNEGDGIIVYRDGVPFISGFVKDVIEEVDESYSGGQVINWTAEGADDNGLLSRRVIIPDPVNLDLTTEAYQTIRNYGGNAILDYIYTQAADGANSGRRIPNLTVDVEKDLGAIQTYKARLQNLWEFIIGIAESQALGIRVVWNGETGHYTATVYTPSDKSDLIIFSREFGNLKKWTRKRSAPAANAVWVAGQGQATDRMFSYREDPESISKWGRIEAVKDRRDLSNEQDENDPRTPQQILDDTAEELIEANKATEGYELELAPIERMSYRDDWELGDIVNVRVGVKEFKAIIEEVKIDYAGGVETVTPSVGTINRGAIAKTYSTIQTISDRVAVLERNEGDGALELLKEHTHNGTDSSKIDVNAIYPIGSIYMSVNSTNPGNLFGGTWVAWGAGRVPVGYDSSQSEFDTVGKTGGEKAHTLITAEMPSHNHGITISKLFVSTDGVGGCWVGDNQFNIAARRNMTSITKITSWVNKDNLENPPTIDNVGSGGAHNNLQPYITCYMWKRTA